MKVEREIKKGHENYEFPLSEKEIESVLSKMPPEYLEGLEKIIITHPLKNEDYKNYGRYVPLPNKKGNILLFIHEKRNGQFVVNLGYQNPNENPEKYFSFERFKKEAYKAVIHEIGHHVGIRDNKDYSEEFAKKFVKQFSRILNDYIN